MLPYAADIYEKLKLQEYIMENFTAKNDDDTTMKAGIDLFIYVMKRSPKVKEEIFNIVALAEDKNIDEVKAQPLVKTMATFKSIYQDKELVDFFKQAMR